MALPLFPTLLRLSPQYVLLDAAQDPLVLDFLRTRTDPSDYQSLYEGEAARNLSEYAPYLAKVGSSDWLNELLEKGWGRSWALFLQAPGSFAEVRAHFRTLLYVWDENKRALYFRFYDPRVLRTFLPTCSPQQLSSLFGPVRFFVSEGAQANQLIRYALGENGFEQIVADVVID